MLPKNRRIQRKYFSQVISRGKRYNSDSFLLHISPIFDEELSGPSRFSFSVSKKVEKLAVKRNKLRRRGYSMVSNYLKKTKPGFLYLFSFKKTYSKDYSVLEKEIKGLLS